MTFFFPTVFKLKKKIFQKKKNNRKRGGSLEPKASAVSGRLKDPPAEERRVWGRGFIWTTWDTAWKAKEMGTVSPRCSQGFSTSVPLALGLIILSCASLGCLAATTRCQ